ncbi:MAG: putative reductase [Blastococcus sp.]|nr:putative reductase [Blastococcus sp.]
MSMLEQSEWEERYGSADAVWSGHPNPQLVAEAADLVPGTALDVGCGEGADAIWLAGRGWQVTAADFSRNALRRGASHAEAADVATRINWLHADLRVWTPPAATFDLVSAQYMHMPPEPRGVLFARLADAVAPGGTLLIVGHDLSDIEAGAHRPDMREMFFTAEEVAGALDAQRWQVVTTASRPRQGHVHEGQDITVHDAVLVSRRRGTGTR